MRSYSETDVFPRQILEAFTMAHFAVSGLPDRDPQNRPLRCHEVARIVAVQLRRQLDKHGYLVIEEKAAPRLTLHIAVVDGHYHHVEHSWLLIGTGDVPTYILDTYAVGRLPQVQLLIPDLGHCALYRPGAPRTDIRTDIVRACCGYGEATSNAAGEAIRKYLDPADQRPMSSTPVGRGRTGTP